MTNSTRSAKDLFLSAVEKPTAGERAAVLDEACAGDAELRREVEELLQAHDKTGNPLERPAQPALVQTILTQSIAERPGMMVGPYKLMEQIGEGGFGLVFVAEQQHPMKRKVALKVIKPGMDTRDVVARFEAERQALALMDHPNIARVLDAGATESGRPYFVMELVRGIPITDYCDKNQLNPRERLELFVTVCHAVQHAHQKGVIHRDIKPSNVLVTLNDGKPIVKVIDFGVAKALNQALTDHTIYTRFSQMVGTPLYMSPEQAEMTSLDIDTRSDVYSLGVLLYELLTGTTPFDRQRLTMAAFDEIRRIIREEEPPKPSTRLSQSGDSLPSIAAQRKTEPAKLSRMFHGDLDWITMKALEKDRTRRYETANGFAADVLRYLNDEAVEASPPTAGYRLRKLARRHRKALAVATAFAALLVAGAAISGGLAIVATRARKAAVAAEAAERDQRKQAENDRNRAIQAESQARANADKALAEARRADAETNSAKRNLYAAHMSLAQQRWEQGYGDAASEILKQHIPAAEQPDLRGWEWYYQHRLCNQELRTFRGHVKNDGKPSAVTAVAFSPDGKQLTSVGEDNTLRIYDVATGHEIKVLRGHTDPARTVIYRPDGSLIASAADDRTVRVWDAMTGMTLHVLKDGVASLKALAFSTNGAMLGTVNWDGEARLWKVSDGSLIRSVRVCQNDNINRELQLNFGLGHAVFGPDLKFVATCSEFAKLSTWNMTDASQTVIYKPDLGDSSNFLAISHDGQWLAVCDKNFVMQLWNTSIPQGTPRTLEGRMEMSAFYVGDYPDLRCAFSPDGRRLAAVVRNKGIIKLWQVPEGRLMRTFSAEAGDINAIAFNFDGSRLASAGSDGTVRLWDVSDGKKPPLKQYDLEIKTVEVSRKEVGNESSYTHWEMVPGKSEIPAEVAASQQVRILGQAGHRIAINADGTRIVSCSIVGETPSRVECKIWDIQSGLPLEPVSQSFSSESRPALEDIVYRVDGVFVVAGLRQGKDDKRVPWSLEVPSPSLRSNDSLDRLLQKFPHCMALKFDSDGSRIAIASDKAISVWDTATGDQVWSIDKPELKDSWGVELAFSPDSRLLAAIGGSWAFVQRIDEHDAPPVFKKELYTNHLAIDGSNTQLAIAASRDLQLFDLTTGQLLFTMRGHTEDIKCLSFSSNEKRLVSGAGDSVRVWDTTTGLELRTLRGHAHGRTTDFVRFSPDGMSLISAAANDTIRIYDARSATSEVNVERESRSLIEYLTAIATSRTDLTARIEAYPGITEAVRQRVREWATRFWEAELRSRAARHIEPLFTKLLLQSDVIAAIEADAALPDDIRSAALKLARSKADEAYPLNRASWDIAVRSDARPQEYERALRAAEVAVRLEPKEFSYINTLGVAQYRAGKFEDAIATLNRSNDHHSKSKDAGPQPADLAFLSMSHHKLGHATEARSFITQLTELLKHPPWIADAEAVRLLREADKVLSTKP